MWGFFFCHFRLATLPWIYCQHSVDCWGQLPDFSILHMPEGIFLYNVVNIESLQLATLPGLASVAKECY